MPKSTSQRESAAQPFRQQAESRWKTRHAGRSAPVADAVQAANYELQVHQIELELQNEELRNTQLELVDVRDSYRDLYDFAPVGYLTLDHRRVVTQANLTATTLLGVERSKLCGARLERFVAKESRDALYLHLQDVREGAPRRSCNLWLRRPDGSQFFARLESTVAGLPIEAGSPLQYRVVLTDISSLHDAEEAIQRSERRFRALTEKAADYISVIDAAGTIIYENPSSNRSLGFAAGELVGHIAFDRLHPGDRPTVERLFKEVVRSPGRTAEVEARVRARDGSWRWLQLVGTNLLEDPAVRGIVLNSHDVTERRKAVEDLRHLNEVLDQRVRERTEAIRILHDVASMANRAQDFKEAIDYCLQRLMAYDGWCFGHALLPAADDADVLLPGCLCHPESARRFARFGELTASMTFRRDGGLPGRASAERKPVWSTQLRRDLAKPRAALARELGLVTAVAFPILVGEKVVAVLELFSDKHVASDDRFTEVMVNVGIQLGRIAERATFEERLLAIADETQQRIAQDLHDDLGQELTGLGLLAETLAEGLAPGEKRSSDLAAGVMVAVERARSKVRSLARRIVPVELELGSLTGALEELAAATNVGAHAVCSFRNSHPRPAFVGRIATHLYRIAQEAVSNAIRHGEPKNIRIELACEDGRTELRVKDDGAGLRPEAARAEGLGLRIMKYRAGLIGGALEVTPVAPHGTGVYCRLAPDETLTPTRRRRKK